MKKLKSTSRQTVDPARFALFLNVFVAAPVARTGRRPVGR
jgi:hypothetical protein